MKKSYSFLLILIIINCFCLFSQTPTDYKWAKKASGTQTEIGNGVATDRDSNVLVTGYIKGTTTFESTPVTTSGEKDVFVAKYDYAGNLKWVKTFGGAADDIGFGIAADNNKNVYITGKFINNVTVDGVVNLTNNGVNDAFLVKYDSLGNVQWGLAFGSTNGDVGEDIVVDFNGDIIITGTFQLTVNFGGQSLTATGQNDVFVAKYNSSGTLQWVKKGGSSTSDEGKGVAVDPSGNVFITGYYSSTGSFDGINLTNTGTSGFDIYIVKYDVAGNIKWAKKGSSPSNSDDRGFGIAADRFGNCYTTGYYGGSTITFSATSANSNGNWEIFAVKYDSSGNIKWVKSFGATNYDYGYEVEVDYNGESSFTGGFGGTVNFGAVPLTSTNSGTEDMFIIKLDTNGTTKWALKAGSSKTTADYVWAEGLTIDKNGNILLTGTFEGDGVFGTTTLNGLGGDETYGEDIFIAKIIQVAPWATTAPDTIITLSASASNCTCNGLCNGSIDLAVSGGTAPYTYNWSNGMTIQDISGLCAGTYTVTVKDPNAVKAISSVVISEPVKLTSVASETKAACKNQCDGKATVTATGGTAAYTYKWSNGANTQVISNLCAGTYTATVIDAGGCMTLSSVAITEYSSELIASATVFQATCQDECDGEITITASGGLAPYTYKWSNGSTIQDPFSLCAGAYTGTVTDANGCMASSSTSIVEFINSLSSNINGISHESILGACDGGIDISVSAGTTPFTYRWSNGSTSEDATSLCPGTYTLTITGADGCNKTITATVNPGPQSVDKDLKSNSLITFYPLPSDNILNIEVKNYDLDKIEIFNLIGEKIASVNTTSVRGQTIKLAINVSAYPSGFYMIQFRSINSLVTRKISVIHK